MNGSQNCTGERVMGSNASVPHLKYLKIYETGIIPEIKFKVAKQRLR
jgi:hypothetical protein